MSADIEQPVAEEPAAPAAVAEEAPPETPVESAERDVESDTLDIPDSSQEGGKVRYVPLAAVVGARAELRDVKAQLATAKEGSARATQLEQQIAALQGQIEQLTPIAQAYHAAVNRQQAPPAPAEDDTEAIALARTLDLYDASGQPDVAKARTVLGLVDRRSKQHAGEAVAPFHEMTVQQRSDANLQRALNTVMPDGSRPDPGVLQALWKRVDRSVSADENSARHLIIQAMGMTALKGRPAAAAPTEPAAQRGPNGQFAPKAEVADPLFTEKAGGRESGPAMALSQQEKDYCKASGMSEADYIKSANNAPWLRR